MFSPEGCWRAIHSLVGRKEYRGVGCTGPAGGGPDPEGCEPDSTAGGAMGGFRWFFANGFCDPDADWPGLGGLGEEWAGMTSSSPD